MNYKILLKKLSSRKFWTMIASLVVSVLTLFNFDENVALQITGLITTFGTAVTYIISEAVIDTSNNKKEVKDEQQN